MFKKLMLLLAIVLVACNSDEEDTTRIELTAEEEAFIQEYEYVTFKLDPTSFGGSLSEKWTDEIHIFLDGAVTTSYIEEVQQELNTINSWVTDGTSVRLVNSLEESDVHLYLGPATEIETLWPDLFNIISESTFSGYASYRFNGNFNIFTGRIWVGNDGMPIFRHELGHVLGLGHGSQNYCGSVSSDLRSFMCSGLAFDYSNFDEAIIKMLYHPDITTGNSFIELELTVEMLLLSGEIAL